MLAWIIGFWELLKTVFMFGIFLLFCFSMLVVILDALIILASEIYWKWRKK